MKKWRNLTDEEADEELRQIAIERELLESGYFNPGNTTPEEGENHGEGQTSQQRTEEEDLNEE